MGVEIHSLAYSIVSPDLDNSDQWHESAGGRTTPDLDLFEKYITEIIAKKDINKVTSGHFINEGTDAENWLQQVQQTDYEEHQDEFEEPANNLSRELNSQIHARANDGVLFIVQATVSGELLINNTGEQRIVSILKLDLMNEQRLKLAEDKDLEELNLEDIFPEPDDLQKGLVYPSVRSEGYRIPCDVKFYQNDRVSDYFHDFLQCEVKDGSLKQAKSVFEVIDRLKEEYTGESADGEDVDRFRELRDETDSGIVTIDSVTDVATDIVGREVTKEEIADGLGVEHPDTLAIDTENLPNVVKYEIDKEISIKFPSSARERVNRQEDEENVEVVINGNDLETSILDK